jgi:tRNA modification GTPase
MKSHTIAAISTPFGSGGIGILRLSGNRSISIAASLFKKSRVSDQRGASQENRPFRSHHFYHGHIIDPDAKGVVDEVLLVAMLAPRSYTREDVVEIHSHSGIIVLGKIFKMLLSAGAVIAEPGEFTKRAFLNGRINLTQAEAVVDIINAKTDTSLSIANQQLAGLMSEKVIRIRDVLLSIRAEIEVAIDFPDEGQEEIPLEAMISKLDKGVLHEIQQQLRDYQQDHFYRDGVKLAIIGRPNVGKSSLMNRLIERDKAIVTDLPGTTRDVLEETFHIKGLPVVIMDTAGLHDPAGEVERIGIEKTRQTIQNADVILFMIDNSQGLHADDISVYHEIENKKHFIVRNKIDLPQPDREVLLPQAWLRHACVSVSALAGTHIDKLKHMIWTEIVGEGGVQREIGIVPNLRHKNSLEQCLVACNRARRGMAEALPFEFVATDIKTAIDNLDRILGDHIGSDVLDQIFSRFCIGK